MRGAQSDRLEAASNEIDELLRFRSASKGRAVPVAELDDAAISALKDRIGDVPTSIRFLRCGPLEVLFTSPELDRQAKVGLVRLRDAQSEDQRLP
jgi:hypothetical protein